MLICRFVSATRDTIVMTKKMAEAGADAALVVTPCYFKSLMNNPALEQHYTKVNEIKHPIATVRQRSCGKLMFSVVSVCLVTRGGTGLPHPCPHRTGTLYPSPDMFKLVQLGLHRTGTPPLGAAGKRAVGLQLKSLLVRK